MSPQALKEQYAIARKLWDKNRSVASTLLGLPAQPWDMLPERTKVEFIRSIQGARR